MDGVSLIGEVIQERYELIEVIGSGGMAVVYKAFDRLMNRNVAFKILKNSLKDDNEIVEKFSAEAKASAGLSHPNIVTIFDVGQYEGLDFIVMELIEGITLKEYINGNKPVKWQTACEIAIQIAEALSVAHEHGIIHRDIKPHNILITKDNVAKVADFGIARAVSSETVVAGGTALGSVYYISPEQARGGYVDQTSDIYSLGVVLYEMLTGALPIEGDNAVSIALKKLEEDPVNPKVINLDIPQELDAIVMRAIAREQHTRYRNAAELIADLKSMLNDDSMRIIPTRIQQQEEVGKKNRKKSGSSFNPIVASVVLVIVVAIATFFIMTSGGKEYIVPDLMGLSLDEAIEKLEGTEFSIDEDAISYEVSKEHEEGKIFHQDPGANQSVKKNKKIKLKISKGKTEGDILVPDIVGDDISDAKELLENYKLKYKVVEEEGEQEQLNKVIGQSPNKNTRVSEGYEVILHVCTKVKEDAELVVPSVEGKTRQQAEQELKNAGFVLGDVKKEYSDKEKDTVILQNPKAGTTAQKNSIVEIVLSDGKEAENNENNSSTNNSSHTPNQSTNPTTGENTNNNSSQNNNSTGTLKKKTATFSFPDNVGDTVHVRILKDGEEIHNKNHAKSEGKVDVLIESYSDAMVQVYMNDELVVQKVIDFD